MTEVQGTVAEGFETVRDEFAAVAEPSGAQLAVYVHGRPVADLWTGSDTTGETLTGIYSSTKGAASLVAALLTQDGVLDLDRPIARCWPRFSAAGKGGITLRQVLSHRSGVIGVDGGLSADELADDAVIARRLSTQAPYWRPGSAYGYGGFVTFAIVNEVVRRVTGRTVPDHFAQRIREPHGLDVWLGLPAAEEHRYRTILPGLATPADKVAFWATVPGPDSLLGIAYGLNTEPPLDQVAFANTRRVRELGQTSGGGVGSARGLAAMYAAAISGIDGHAPLLSAETLAAFTAIHSIGGDLVRGESAAFGLGFEAKSQRYPCLGARAFGHGGSAGSEALADPATGIAVGYTRRRFAFDWNYPEHDRLVAAVHRAATTGNGAPA